MPQLENGYLQIANELFDALIKFKLPGNELRIALFVIRKTYGYNKLSDWISNSQFVRGTGINKSNICRCINSLILKKIIAKDDNKNRPKYRFNKNYWQWKMVTCRETKPKVTCRETRGDLDDNSTFGDHSDNENQSSYCSSVKDLDPEKVTHRETAEKQVLSPGSNTKDSNNVTKNRGGAEGAEKANHKKIKRWRDLKKIVGGSRDHALVSKYAVECGIAGVSFEELISWAQRKLKEIEQDN